MAINSLSTGFRPGVCTSSTRPTAPYEGQQIYETDTDLMLLYNGSAWVEINSALTKAPRGIISRTNVTSTSSAVSIETLRITSPSFTAVANRYYRISYYEPACQFVSGTVTNFDLKIKITDINGTAYQLANPTIRSAGSNAGFCSVVTTLTAGATVFVATFQPTGGGTGQCYGAATAVAQLIIEDIGGV